MEEMKKLHKLTKGEVFSFANEKYIVDLSKSKALRFIDESGMQYGLDIFWARKFAQEILENPTLLD